MSGEFSHCAILNRRAKVEIRDFLKKKRMLNKKTATNSRIFANAWLKKLVATDFTD